MGFTCILLTNTFLVGRYWESKPELIWLLFVVHFRLFFYVLLDGVTWADPEGGGDRGSGPPPGVLIGFVKWYWFDIAQHLCKIQS